MNLNVDQIKAYLNIGLLVLFIALVVGVALAAFRGFRRGVWKSTHNMVFILSLIIIAFVTLDPICKFVENFNIGQYLVGTFKLSQVKDGVESAYYVPVTTVKETAAEFIKGMYMLFNISSSSASATNFAFAIVESLIKVVLFIVDMILIVTLGNLLSFITWYLIAQHLVPRIARRVVKIRWLAAIETAATYLVLTVLFMTPFTSIINSLNQSYQKNRPTSDNEIVQNIGNFVDAYDDSLFAKILFNWSVDDNGMTIDTKLFSTFTTGVSEDVVVNIVNELGNLTNLAVIATQGIYKDQEGKTSFDAMRLIYQDTVNSIFDVLGKSNLISNILPMAAELALNSGVLDQVIPAHLLNVSDVEWNKEIGNVQEMVNSFFESGIIDALITVDEYGKRNFRSFQGNDLYDFLDEILYSDKFDEVLNVFKAMDNSKILSRLVPAFVYMFENGEQGVAMKQFLPFSWEELNEFSWGFELYALFDFLHQTVAIDRDFLKAFLVQTGAYTPAEGERYTKLPTVISRNISKFNQLIVGEIDNEGKVKNADKYGRTIVFDKGKRLEDRHYCLLDMKIFEMALPTVLNNLYSLDFMKSYADYTTETDELSYKAAVDKLSQGVVLSNFKNEFNNILNILGTLGKDEGLVGVLFGENINTIMDDPNNFFSIKTSTIDVFKEALIKIEDSSLLYFGIVPIIKSLLGGPEVTNAFKDLGLRNDILISAINHDAKKTDRSLFTDLASLLNHWNELSNVFTAFNGGTDNIMDKLKDVSLVDDLTSILKAIIENPIINPTPEAGDTYEKNENLYILLEYVFSMTGDSSLTVTRDTLRNVESPSHTWGDEIDAFGDIIKYVASHDVMNAADLFKDGLTRSAISNLKDEGDGKVGLPKLFTLIDKSYIFSSSLGPFLDKMFADTLSGFLIDSGNHVSFSNIVSWTDEGNNIGNLLDSLYTLVPANDEEAKTFLSNFDMSKLHNIVELNDMLHQLSHSGIFTYIDESSVKHYQFGKWFYGKVSDTMAKFTVNSSNYDLLADPKPDTDSTWTWKDSWGKKPGEMVTDADPYFVEYQNAYNPDGTLVDTHMIAYRDFVYLKGLANTDDTLPTEWCDYEAFTVKQEAFLAAHEADLTNPSGQYLAEEANVWGDYFGSDKFVSDYTDVFDSDEISRVCRFMTYSMRVLEKATKGPNAGNQVPFNQLPNSLVEGLLTSINETSCLRICLYSFYRIAGENLLNGYSAFNLSSAYNAYMVDANYDIMDFANARVARKAEIDKLVDFYEVINKAKDKGIIDSSNNFDYSKLNKDGFLNDMKEALKDLGDSYIFHRLGSAKVGSVTTFQGLFNSMLKESSIKDSIYLGANSPKDANATNYSSKDTKVDYLVKSTFLTDKEISDLSLDYATQINKHHVEIDNLLNSVDAFYSLKDKDGNTVTNINNVDMKRSDNIETIETLFNNLNNSNLLSDCLPNTIYKIFIENDQFNIESNGQKVNFSCVDPYYHYFYNDMVARSEANYSAKYLTKDINSIVKLLEDYQELDTQLDGKEMSNPLALKAITGEGGALKDILMDMHNSNLFHSPARRGDYPGISYYTDKFDNGYTLFEEMIAKICSFVSLDTFAYDSSYDPQASASAKLHDRIKETTQADDTGISTNVYHQAQGLAWSQEVDAIMKLANTAADLGSGSSLDISTFALDQLDPIDIKNMLKAVNSSDIVCDALPKFIKDGFDSINLGTLTTYDTVNYAYYRLGQVVYGGSNANADEGTEIDNIYQVMNSIHKEGTPKYVTNMDNLNEFVQGTEGEARLTGLLRYVYKSHILNTSLHGNYDEYNTLTTGQKITAQGIMLNNSLGTDLSSYIARDADASSAAKSEADKIATLSKLVHMHNYFEDENDITYIVEAKGLKQLIDLTTDEITATTFSDNNIETIKSKKALILQIVECAYNATNETDPTQYKRSAIASEFVSGLFNYILENQYTKLDTTPAYAAYRYQLFSFGNDDANTLTLSDYNELDVVERDGLEGIIDSLSYIGTTSTPASMKANSESIKDCFTMMGKDAGNNSHLAQALYLTEAHQYIKLLRNPLVLNAGEMFVPVDETVTDPSVDNNIYSNTFSFKEYGEYIHTFLSGATILI